jgi:hypothetical protein
MLAQKFGGIAEREYLSKQDGGHSPPYGKLSGRSEIENMCGKEDGGFGNPPYR